MISMHHTMRTITHICHLMIVPDTTKEKSRIYVFCRWHAETVLSVDATDLQ